ncbi:MAG: AMP-binding protein [Bacteroidota bacterium]
MNTYLEDYTQSLQDTEKFWLQEAEKIDWFERPERGLVQHENGLFTWFDGGKMNTSYLALDYQVENGRADQQALIYDSPVTQTQYSLTYRQLRDKVAHFAGGLKKLGLRKGDTAIIYMPMVPEAAVAILACARLGVIHSVVFGGFAAHELAIRIDDAEPKVLLTASGGIEVSRKVRYEPIVEAALEEANHKVNTVVMLERPHIPLEQKNQNYISWKEVSECPEAATYEILDATDPLYILYTSGTTGKPKGIVRDNGGHAVALKYSMKTIYGVDPGDVYWAASDIGWVVGHSYIIYGPLIQGCTSIMFEGKPIKTPDPSTFWRIMSQYKVKSFFTAPTAFRAIRKEDPTGSFKAAYPTPELRYIFLAGERCDVSTLNWLRELTQVPVLDHWWQTESGWPMMANMAGYGLFPIKEGSAGKRVPSFDIRILDEEGNEVPHGEEGSVAIKYPLPPSCLPTLWKNDQRFKDSYLSRYPGYYLAGDGGYRDEEGYFYITGRIDDVINVAGHRLSTSEMEEVVASHWGVAECAVIGVANSLKGQIPVAFVVLKEGTSISSEDLEKELILMVRNTVGAVASFKRVSVAKRLPKTRSGKILRKIMRYIADGKSFNMPSTIEDPVVLDEIRENMHINKIGIAFDPTGL